MDADTPGGIGYEVLYGDRAVHLGFGRIGVSEK
jgi:hypothetical protein